MQPRTTVVLFLVAAALGAFVYLYEIEGGAGRDREEEASRRLFPEVDASAVGFLLFRTKDDRLVEAVRIGENWHLQQPVEFPGDDVNLNSIASTLANLTSETAIDSPAAPEVYRLGNDSRRVQFRAGDKRYTLQLGGEAPVGGNIYVARDDAPNEVVTVAAFRVNSFDRDLDSLRDKRVLSFDRAQVKRVVAGWPGGSVTIDKSEAGWQITHPAAAVGPADQKTIDDLLSDVSFLRAEGFVDEGEEATAAAGVAPIFTLRLGLEEQEGAPLEVGLGVSGDGDDENYLVRGRHARTLYRVPRARIDGLPRDLFAYRFKEISNFETSAVQAFEIVFQPKSGESSVEPVTVRVERTDDGWASTGDAWRPGKAAALVAEFARLEATSVESEEATAGELASFGLSPARITLRAFGGVGEAEVSDTVEAPSQIAEVVLGDLDSELGFPARAAGQKQVFRLDAALAEEIPASLASFQSDFLAPPPSEADEDSGDAGPTPGAHGESSPQT